MLRAPNRAHAALTEARREAVTPAHDQTNLDRRHLQHHLTRRRPLTHPKAGAAPTMPHPPRRNQPCRRSVRGAQARPRLRVPPFDAVELEVP
jgi:hypothetical protein